MSISRKQGTSVIASAIGGTRPGGFEDQQAIGLKQSEGPEDLGHNSGQMKSLF